MLTVFVIAVLIVWAVLFGIYSIVKYFSCKKKNPYIDYHKLKDFNDKSYDEYLDWLNKKGSGVPVSKVQTMEDAKAEQQIKSML